MAFTYTTLKTAIQDYTQNSETTFVNQLNTFIVNAEERILKEVQLSVFRKNSEGSTSAGNQFLSKPTDFLAPYSLSVKNGSNVEFLLYKQVTFLQDYNPDSTSTGMPGYYADWNDTTFLLSPPPTGAYDMQLHYFYRPDSITTVASGETWLGTNASLALLYGSLVEAYTFMKGEDNLLKLYNDRYMESLNWLKNLGEGENTRDSYRYDDLRRDVQ
jgi:hypothetical protein|tara:strand:- start:227 stop:871 length:645 start_codon:yes stop_codon:yes gene_type:complete